MQIISDFTGVTYDSDDAVRIYNNKQISKYIQRGMTVLDFGTAESGDFYMVFSKVETRDVFDLWCRHEL